MQTLCWDCAKSTSKECKWSEKFRPVNGWTADKTKNGYFVKNCPLFERDSYEGGAIKIKDYEQVLMNRRWRAAKRAAKLNK